MGSMPQLTLRQKIAQLIFPRIGSNLPPVRTVTEDRDRVAKLLHSLPIGGLCLFNGSWPETRTTLAELQEIAEIPLLVAADLERGAGQHIRGMTVFPHAMAVAQGQSPESAITRCARITAEQARAVGIHIVTSPVADVQSDPRNPIIATRAFSVDPNHAARCVTAAIEGLHAGGAFAVAKHFPGHGNTYEDSHDALPRVESDLTILEQRDLLPFRAAIAANVRIIMTAHVAYPALDASLPATVSRPILTELLRGRMGYDGAIMTDSLLMAGIRNRFPDETSMALAVLRAGGDILLDVADPLALVEGIAAAVEIGAIEEVVVDQACARIWRLKQALFDSVHLDAFPLSPELIDDRTEPSSVETPGQFPSVRLDIAESFAEGEALAEQVAEAAITEMGTQLCEAIVPQSGTFGVIVIRPYQTRWDPPEQPIVNALRMYRPDLVAGELNPESIDAQSVIQTISQCDIVLIALIVKPAAWQRFGLLPEQVEAVHRLAKSNGVTLLSLGVPTVLADFPEIARRCCTLSDVAVSQRAVARYLAIGRNRMHEAHPAP